MTSLRVAAPPIRVIGAIEAKVATAGSAGAVRRERCGEHEFRLLAGDEGLHSERFAYAVRVRVAAEGDGSLVTVEDAGPVWSERQRSGVGAALFMGLAMAAGVLLGSEERWSALFAALLVGFAAVLIHQGTRRDPAQFERLVAYVRVVVAPLMAREELERYLAELAARPRTLVA